MDLMVVGFLFDDVGKKVCLIQKSHPKWQRGRLNGIGGHIKLTELPEEAMRRKFSEEADIDVAFLTRFTVLMGRDWRVYFYFSFNSDAFCKAKGITDEPLQKIRIGELTGYLHIPNLSWLIPMALSMKYEKALSFSIQEIYYP